MRITPRPRTAAPEPAQDSAKAARKQPQAQPQPQASTSSIETSSSRSASTDTASRPRFTLGALFGQKKAAAEPGSPVSSPGSSSASLQSPGAAPSAKAEPQPQLGVLRPSPSAVRLEDGALRSATIALGEVVVAAKEQKGADGKMPSYAGPTMKQFGDQALKALGDLGGATQNIDKLTHNAEFAKFALASVIMDAKRVSSDGKSIPDGMKATVRRREVELAGIQATLALANKASASELATPGPAKFAADLKAFAQENGMATPKNMLNDLQQLAARHAQDAASRPAEPKGPAPGGDAQEKA
jgi:hypothetical protein